MTVTIACSADFLPVLSHPDSVILKLPARETESVDATTSPVTPGQDTTPIVPALPNTEAEASAEAAEELPEVDLKHHRHPPHSSL